MVRSSRAGVWISVGVAVFGLLAAIGWSVLQFVLLTRDVGDLGRATADAPYDFIVDDRVGWTLFVEPDSASLTLVRFSVTDTATGDEMPLGAYDAGFSYSTPSHSGRAVATVALPAGRYRLEVDGPVTMAVGPSPASRLAWLFGGAAVIGAPLVVGGGAAAVVAAVRDTRRRTRAALPPSPSPWSAGEWPREPPG